MDKTGDKPQPDNKSIQGVCGAAGAGGGMCEKIPEATQLFDLCHGLLFVTVSAQALKNMEIQRDWETKPSVVILEIL